MNAPSARTVVVAAAAAALTATAAFGQQLAATEETDRVAYLDAQCGHIRDANLQLGCRAVNSIEFSQAQIATNKKSIAESQKRIEAAQQRVEAANTGIAESQCATELAEGLKLGDVRFRPERGRAILNGKTPREFGYCNLRDALTKS